MLVIYIEFWPGGDHTRSVPIGHGSIANVSKELGELGNYEAKFLNTKQAHVQEFTNISVRTTVTGYPRQENGAWRLLYHCLRNIFNKE